MGGTPRVRAGKRAVDGGSERSLAGEYIQSGVSGSVLGTSLVERGDDKVLLGEMAENRAVKRATSNATGVGMAAVAEMKSATEGER
jgi:hypothetical protein